MAEENKNSVDLNELINILNEIDPDRAQRIITRVKEEISNNASCGVFRCAGHNLGSKHT